MTVLSLMAKERSQEKGEMLRLIRLVAGKVQRGYDPTVIAELFEKPPAQIEALCSIVSGYPEKDADGWYEIAMGRRS